MSLRQAATAAYATSNQELADDARAALAEVLTPEDVSALRIAKREVTRTHMIGVFTDGDLHFAVRRPLGDPDAPWEVSLVERRDGEWTVVGEVTSLAGLGELIVRG